MEGRQVVHQCQWLGAVGGPIERRVSTVIELAAECFGD